MVDWQMMEGIGGLATALALVVALAFGAFQVRDGARARRDAVGYAAISLWSDLAFTHHLDVVYALPDAAPPDAVAAADAEGDVSAVSQRWEMVAILVHGRQVPLALANEWVGPAVRVSWRKLRPWVEAKRARAGSQGPGEWFQWLAERFAEMPARDEKLGAFDVHRGWRP